MEGDDAGGGDVEHDVDAQPREAAAAAQQQGHRAELFAAHDTLAGAVHVVGVFSRGLADGAALDDAQEPAVLPHHRQGEEAVVVEEAAQGVEVHRVGDADGVFDHDLGHGGCAAGHEQAADGDDAAEHAFAIDDVGVLDVVVAV